KRSLVNGDPIWAKTSNPSSSHDGAYALAVDGTGLYVAGADAAPGNNQWRIEKRSLVNGDPIWAKTSNPSSSHDGAYALAVDGTGLYVAGADAVPGNNQWRIEKRSLVNGDPIWTKTSNPSSSSDEPYALAVDSTGLYAAGIDIVAVPGNIQWRIEKREICPACSAVPPSPSILQLCRDGVPVAQGGGTYDFSLSTGTTTNIKAYYDADATSGHQCDAGSTDVTAFVTFTETDSTGGALSLSANGTNPKVFTGASAGAETVTVSYSGQTVTMNATVTCVETVNCAPEKSAVCTGSTVPSGTVKVGTCGNVDCSGEQGTRFCDFNWKEVAPGQ
nr:hypothetical protein [Candidatus Moranbacteria bacterium]